MVFEGEAKESFEVLFGCQTDLYLDQAPEEGDECWRDEAGEGEDV